MNWEATKSPPCKGGEPSTKCLRGGVVNHDESLSDHPVCASLNSAQPPLLSKEGIHTPPCAFPIERALSKCGT